MEGTGSLLVAGGGGWRGVPQEFLTLKKRWARRKASSWPLLRNETTGVVVAILDQLKETRQPCGDGKKLASKVPLDFLITHLWNCPTSGNLCCERINHLKFKLLLVFFFFFK